ncbi:MAG TPA: VOC family protein [bacterium]
MDEKALKPGMFSWFELLTSDVAAAKKFYGALFGWTTKDMDTPNTPYTIVSANGEEVAGMMPIPPAATGMPPAWGVYVTVADVDATVRRVGELGGSTVMPPTDIPGMLRFAVVRDPQGATFSVITYAKK